MNDLVAEWVAKGDGDFNSAQRELRARRLPNYDAACFHSQQCAEKYLKAFLVTQAIEPPRVHNLVVLLGLCMEQDATFELLRPSLILLNSYAVDIRYPGDFATKEEAQQAVAAVKHVREFVKRKF